jgi:hypothetical protein
MPYEITFARKLNVEDHRHYINKCCVGGDIVMAVLLPELRRRYSDLGTGQEDWGWFAWFQDRNVRLAIEVFCDDPTAGSYRMHVTSRVPKRFFGHRIEETPELESLRDGVSRMLATWLGEEPRVTQLNADYMPY